MRAINKSSAKLLEICDSYDNCKSEKVRQLIKKGADVNVQMEDFPFEGQTPLMCACVHWNKEVCAELIKNGANINQCSADGRSALHYAVEQGHIEIIKLLLDNGANINLIDKRKNSVLSKFYISGADDIEFSIRILDLLLNYGIDINKKNRGGDTLLFRACQITDKIDFIEYLISKGADINALNNKGSSVLIKISGEYGKLNLMEYLIKHGADISAQEKSGEKETPLLSACGKYGGADAIKLLLKYNPNINTQDKEGNTVLMRACKRWQNNIIELLIEADADLNIKNKEGKTALDYAYEELNRYPINTITRKMVKNLVRCQKKQKIEKTISTMDISESFSI